MIEHDVLDRIDKALPELRAHAAEAERLGRLPDSTVALLKQTGVVRLLQPIDHGGEASDPRVFFEAVMRISAACGASGWVAGIVGVHPWELSFYPARTQDEVWGDDPDTWVSSSYMPSGTARRVSGGYEVTGRWYFSSGSDACDWVLLGVRVVDDDGEPLPLTRLHTLLPRSDYEIVDGTWDVVGLRGTGSKDVVVDGAFVPDHHTVNGDDFRSGAAPGSSGYDWPVFRMPWASIFPNAITAGVIGMAEGGLAAHLEYQRVRSNPVFTSFADLPVMLATVGEAAAEIDACRAQLLRDLTDVHALVERGDEIPTELRARARRNQVRNSWRATRALDDVFDLSGGRSLQRSGTIQRLWRDAHAGLHHAINMFDVAYPNYTRVAMGFEPMDPMM